MLCGNPDCEATQGALREHVALLEARLRDTLPYVLNVKAQAVTEGQTWRAETAEEILTASRKALGAD